VREGSRVAHFTRHHKKIESLLADKYTVVNKPLNKVDCKIVYIKRKVKFTNLSSVHTFERQTVYTIYFVLVLKITQNYACVVPRKG